MPDGLFPDSQEFLENLTASLKPHRRSRLRAPKGNQRPPLLVVRPPAYGIATVLMLDVLHLVCTERKLATSWPASFRINFSDDLRIMTWTPEMHHDPTDPQLLPAQWSDGNRHLVVNLFDVFHPRRLLVPEGHAMEISVDAKELPGMGWALIFFVGQHRLRPVRESDSPESPSPSGNRQVPAQPDSPSAKGSPDGTPSEEPS